MHWLKKKKNKNKNHGTGLCAQNKAPSKLQLQPKKKEPTFLTLSFAINLGFDKWKQKPN